MKQTEQQNTEIRSEQNINQKNHNTTEKKSVLVVDDNSDLLNLCQTILELGDFNVHTALGGQAALTILNGSCKPDLILLDMRMKEMSGLDFLKNLEETRPELIENVPVVFLTGLDEVPTSKAVGHITKPIRDFEQFLKTIHLFIESGTGRKSYNH